VSDADTVAALQEHYDADGARLGELVRCPPALGPIRCSPMTAQDMAPPAQRSAGPLTLPGLVAALHVARPKQRR